MDKIMKDIVDDIPGMALPPKTAEDIEAEVEAKNRLYMADQDTRSNNLTRMQDMTRRMPATKASRFKDYLLGGLSASVDDETFNKCLDIANRIVEEDRGWDR